MLKEVSLNFVASGELVHPRWPVSASPDTDYCFQQQQQQRRAAAESSTTMRPVSYAERVVLWLTVPNSLKDHSGLLRYFSLGAFYTDVWKSYPWLQQGTNMTENLFPKVPLQFSLRK